MKNRVLIALSLASVLSVAAPAVSALAAEAAVESSQDAPSVENGTESSGEKSRGKRGEKPSNAEGTTDGTMKEGRRKHGSKSESAEGETDGTMKDGCGKHGKKEEVAEPENAIGKDAAKEKALADAGIAADVAGKVRARLSTLEDGTVVYKVKFTVDSQKYSYKIDAVSGNIVDKSTEAVTAEDEAKEGHGHGKRGGMKNEASETQAETTAV